MTISAHADIENHAESINALATRRHTAGFTQGELYNLRELAVMCGYPGDRVGMVRDIDLQEVLKAALRSPAQAIMVTARVARANGVTIETASAPLPDIFGEPAQEPAPGPATPGLSMADVQRACRVVERALTEHIDGHVHNISDDVDSRFEAFRASVPALIEAELAKRTAVNLVLTMPGKAPEPVGLVHFQTPRILRALANRLNVYLHGPAGTGKTTAGRKAAEAFKLPFYTTAKVESEYLLLGFRDAKGEAVRTPFREAYEHGGVFLFDEMDASSPGAIVALNMALANGVCPFPDGLVKRHDDFHCIGAGNTTLGGATRAYAGRNQLDAASVDRFYFIEFPYDEPLEMELATDKLWCAYVQRIRRAVKERGLNHLVTPRASFDGSKALAMGDTWEEAEMACIFKGLDQETVDVLRRAVPQPAYANPL